jgi:hypothetical protein
VTSCLTLSDGEESALEIEAAAKSGHEADVHAGVVGRHAGQDQLGQVFLTAHLHCPAPGRLLVSVRARQAINQSHYLARGNKVTVTEGRGVVNVGWRWDLYVF